MPRLEELLTDSVRRLTRPVERDGVLEQIAHRKHRRRTTRRIQAGFLAVAVIAGSAGASYGLIRIFQREEERPVSLPPGKARIAFHREVIDRIGPDSYSTLASDVFVMNGRGEHVTRLTRGLGAGMPAWSPDGSRLAVTNLGGAGLGEFIGATHILKANGTRGRSLFASGESPLFESEMDPAWSPDGARLAIVHAKNVFGFDADIYTVRPDGTGLRRLTHHPGFDAYPAWSPDGSQIVFTSDRDGSFDLYVMDTDGRNTRQLTDFPGEELMPAWSPDGSRVAYVRSTRTAEEGWDDHTAMDVLGGPDLSVGLPDGSVVWDTWPIYGLGDIYMVEIDGSGNQPLTEHPAEDLQPAWSPDGRQIAFVSLRDASAENHLNAEIYVMRSDGRNVRRLTHNPGKDSDPAWQPNPAVAPAPRPLPRCRPEQISIRPASEGVGASVGLILVHASLIPEGGLTCRVNTRLTLSITDEDGDQIAFEGNPAQVRVRGRIPGSKPEAWLWRPCLPLPDGGAGGFGYRLDSRRIGVRLLWEAEGRRVIDPLRIHFEPGCDPTRGSLTPMGGA